jgi:hypothetical protein
MVCLVILLPAAWAAAEGPLRFCITADSRGSNGYLDILDQIKLLPGSAGAFMVSVGDISPPDKTRKQLDAAFGASLPWYPVVGNHEAVKKDNKLSADAMQYLRDYFDQHIKAGANPGPAGTEQTTYSFDAGDVHIAVLNEYWDGKEVEGSDAKLDGDIVAPLREWLAKDLKASAKPWKLVFGHEPAYPQADEDWSGGLFSSRHSASSLNKYKARRDAFWKAMEDGGAAAYICGHTHRYSRYQPKDSKVWQIDAAQAAGGTSWKYDAFIIVTADAKSLKFEVYRSLKEKYHFALDDTLALPQAAPETVAH